MIRHTTGSPPYTICGQKYFVEILNGVCTRGIVNMPNPAAVCKQWTDSKVWKDIDEKNAKLVRDKVPYSYASDTEKTVWKWTTIRSMCILSIPLAFINMILCLVAADVDVEFFDLDFDKWTIVVSTVCNLLCMIAFLIAVCYSYWSDVLKKGTWTNTFGNDSGQWTCHFKSAPAYGYFIMVLGGFFSLLSLYMSIVSFFYVYVLGRDDTKPMGNQAFSPLTNAISPAPIEEEDEESDDEDERPNKQEQARESSPLTQKSGSRVDSPMGSRPRSANSVAPEPPSNFSGIVLG